MEPNWTLIPLSRPRLKSDVVEICPMGKIHYTTRRMPLWLKQVGCCCSLVQEARSWGFPPALVISPFHRKWYVRGGRDSWLLLGVIVGD